MITPREGSGRATKSAAGKRTPKETRVAKARASYEAYRALISERGRTPDVGATPRHKFKILVATCTGSSLLSGQIGLPLAHVDVVDDPEAAIEHLRRIRHGSCQPLSFTSAPFAHCSGWDDWRWERISPDMAGTAELGLGVVVERGAISVECRASTPMGAVRRSIAAGLAHLRLQDAGSTGAAIADRHRLGAPTLVTARYTPVRRAGLEECVRVDDLYVLDPWVGLRGLANVIGASVLQEDDRASPAEPLRFDLKRR